jgi:hypothetical protein
MHVVHIRTAAPVGLDLVALCDAVRPIESISRSHFETHVVQFKDDCCAGLWARLCPDCRARAALLALVDDAQETGTYDRIEDTSPTYERVPPDEVADALGAEQ